MSELNNKLMGEIYGNIWYWQNILKILKNFHTQCLHNWAFSISESTAPHQVQCRREQKSNTSAMVFRNGQMGLKWGQMIILFLIVTRSMIWLRYLTFNYALTNHCWSWTQIFLSRYWLIISRQPVLHTTQSSGPTIVNCTFKDKDKICHIRWPILPSSVQLQPQLGWGNWVSLISN